MVSSRDAATDFSQASFCHRFATLYMCNFKKRERKRMSLGPRPCSRCGLVWSSIMLTRPQQSLEVPRFVSDFDGASHSLRQLFDRVLSRTGQI